MKKTKSPKKKAAAKTKRPARSSAHHPHKTSDGAAAVHEVRHHSIDIAHHHVPSRKQSHLNRKQAYFATGLFAIGLIVVVAVYNSYSPPGSSESSAERTEDQQNPGGMAKTATTMEKTASPVMPNPPEEETTDRPCLSKKGPLAAEFLSASKMDLAARINYWSEYLEKNRGARKKVAAIAAGQTTKDEGPLVTEGYDSVKYVETVTALARSDNSTQFVKNLLAVRYKDGKSEFSTRNYFIDADWIPNNRDANILRDVTADVGRAASVTVATETNKIVRLKWLQEILKKNRKFRNVASVDGAEKNWAISADVEVPYIGLEDLKKSAGQLPSGSIINLVHAADPGHAGLITHHGFVIKKNNEVLFRHASSRGQIRSHELLGYLAKLGQKKSKPWALIGVNIDQVMASSSDKSCLSSDI